jgi:hypothetical protein
MGSFNFGGRGGVKLVTAPGGFGRLFSSGVHRSSRKDGESSIHPPPAKESVGKRYRASQIERWEEQVDDLDQGLLLPPSLHDYLPKA